MRHEKSIELFTYKTLPEQVEYLSRFLSEEDNEGRGRLRSLPERIIRGIVITSAFLLALIQVPIHFLFTASHETSTSEICVLFIPQMMEMIKEFRSENVMTLYESKRVDRLKLPAFTFCPWPSINATSWQNMKYENEVPVGKITKANLFRNLSITWKFLLDGDLYNDTHSNWTITSITNGETIWADSQSRFYCHITFLFFVFVQVRSLQMFGAEGGTNEHSSKDCSLLQCWMHITSASRFL